MQRERYTAARGAGDGAPRPVPARRSAAL